MKVRTLKLAKNKTLRKNRWRNLRITWTETIPKDTWQAHQKFLKAWVDHVMGPIPPEKPSTTPKAIRYAHCNFVKLNGRRSEMKRKPRIFKKHALRHAKRNYRDWLKKNPPTFNHLPAGVRTPVFYATL